jgi:CRP-like cAMP-binding protein
VAKLSPTKRENEKRVRTLKERLDKATAQRKTDLAEVILEELEELEPDNDRWPHLRGDALRKLGRARDAIDCYERAAQLFADAGFLPRAIAMAKVVLELDPNRFDVLERIDPSAARELHRKLRPEGVRVAEIEKPRKVDAAAEPLDPAPEAAAPGEVRFSNAPPSRRTLEIDITEIELAEREQPSLIPPDDSRREAERQACLPLLPLFAEAPPAALLQLARESELVQLADGAFAVRRGDPADALFGIVEGAVHVIVPGLEPDAYPRLGAGDIFGEASLLGGEPRRADVRAEGALTALRIPKHTLTQLVQLHPGLGDVLFEMLTRRLLANLLHTSRVFAELGPVERREVAAEFELRRARAGTQLLVPGKRADALYITLTGQVEVQTPGAPARVEGAGMMFGHASMLEGGACEAGVRTLDTLLVLRLPRQAFSRVAMQYPAILMRLSELEQVARVGQ